MSIMSEPDCLDHKLCREMAEHLEELTTSGKPVLNTDTMKKFKKICRVSDIYVQHAFRLLMTQLEEEHSEIRLSTFQMMDELFNRSHQFRELLVSDFQTFLELTVEVDPNQPLPPPKSSARALKSQALKAIQQWHEKYGEAYKKLALGFNFLKNCKKVDFNDIREQSEAERLRSEENERKRQAFLTRKLTQTIEDMQDTTGDIQTCLTEVENCFELLLPRPDSFFISEIESKTASNPKETKSNDIPSAEGSFKHLGENNSQGLESGAAASKPEVCDNCKFTKSKKSQTTCNEGEKSGEHGDRQEEEEDGIHCCCAGRDRSELKQRSIILGSCSKSPGKSTCQEEIDNCLTETGGTGSVPDQGTGSDSESEGSDEGFEDVDDMDGGARSGHGFFQEHGMTNRKYRLSIEVPSSEVSIQENDDNRDILATVRERYRIISGTYLPKVSKWLQALSKTGADQVHLKKAIDLKNRLEDTKRKYIELQVISPEETAQANNGSDDEDDDFEEVPEKEGFEPRIPDHLRKEYGVEPETSKDINKAYSHMAKDKNSLKHKVEKKTMASGKRSNTDSINWKINRQETEEDLFDPTTWTASLAKIASRAPSATVSSAQQPSTSDMDSENSAHKAQDNGKDLIKKAPVISYGVDIEHWEDPENIEAPMIEKSESLHRWWKPPTEAEEAKDSTSALTTRTFHYVGEFKPVEWKCRAPMPDGKLCERMDRKKCPFHGKIISRDEAGQPTDPEDIQRLAKEKVEQEKDAVPDWQDPELQRDIEAATGLDLGSGRSRGRGKGKGKGKKEKKDGLTDITKSNNTSRARLESKIFARGAVKRVAAALDNATYKRVRDKFANQFNYIMERR